MTAHSIGVREKATKFVKVGGKAFPGDYNWVCPNCGSECRAYELTCYSCEMDARRLTSQ